MNELRKYIRKVLTEVIDTQTKVYYHGTPSKEAAESILRSGIQPPDLSSRQGVLTPVQGKVYITPDISYAQIYAIGGDLAGNDASRMVKTYGQFGYMFVIDGNKLGDIQPDEDSVGEMIHDEEVSWLSDMARYYLDEEPYDDEGQDLGYYSLYDAVMGGEYDAWATAGKFLLDEMSDSQKQKLIDAGAHIANTGVLIPSRAYRIDRNKTQQLKRDGSNFFALAEEIA
tara:strand:- start:155 stop:835 length:681 start_codon:yes stop_codon:yes gene_type:complete